jgi:hypothetical protein
MFKLEINTDNDAFTDVQEELARILRALARDLAEGGDYLNSERSVRDSNGNCVGSFTLTA